MAGITDWKITSGECLGWELVSLGSAKEKLLEVVEEVVDGDLAVDGGPDHGPPVCSLEVPPHNFIQLAVT